MTGHRAPHHDDAERWDLEFWQALSPEDRLSALVHIHEDIRKVQKSGNTGS
ncbi:hypothetical protein JXA40_09850 [bacterium]|nr:hypothetical protein [candidate division CSSED10-310 bacterium]